MNKLNRTSLITKATLFAGVAALSSLVSLPGLAQTTHRSGNGFPNPDQSFPGPSERPSGNPSVPSVSPQQDPGYYNPDPTGVTNTPHENLNRSSHGNSYDNRESLNNNSRRAFPNPDQSVLGPSERPSGNPSIPSMSHVQDPGSYNPNPTGITNTPNNPRVGPMSNMDNSQQSLNEGQGASDNRTGFPNPDQSFPGPSERPSGNPSVPSVSPEQDPGYYTPGPTGVGNTPGNNGMNRNMPNNSSPGRTNDQNSMNERGGFPNPDQSVPGPSERPSGNPSVPSVSPQQDPGTNIPGPTGTGNTPENGM